MRPAPRVRCGSCHHAWYGPTTAHGLRLLGECPRCGGELEFLTPEEPAEARMEMTDELRAASPATILGLPRR
jgi:transcription initiation factor IIE alpha subunit